MLHRWNFSKYVVAGLVVVAIAYYVDNFINRRQAVSIGIIGGADGPTAIFLAGKLGSHYIVWIGALIFLLALCILLSKR